jgi:hypothetical protein
LEKINAQDKEKHVRLAAATALPGAPELVFKPRFLIDDIGTMESLMDAFSFIADIGAGEEDQEEEDAWDDKGSGQYRYFHFLRAQEAIEPNSSLGFGCTITTMMLVLYSAFLIPARLGFESENDAGPMSKFLDIFSEWWFVWDIVVNLHMGYEDSDTGQLVLDLKTIRRVYYRSWFPIDASSSVPFETLSQMVPAVSSLSAIKILRLCKLFRLVKLLKLKALEDMEDNGTLSPTTIRLSKITFTFVFLVHVVACCYWHVVLTTCVFCDKAVMAPNSPQAYWADCTETGHHNMATFATPDFCPVSTYQY